MLQEIKPVTWSTSICSYLFFVRFHISDFSHTAVIQHWKAFQTSLGIPVFFFSPRALSKKGITNHWLIWRGLYLWDQQHWILEHPATQRSFWLKLDLWECLEDGWFLSWTEQEFSHKPTNKQSSAGQCRDPSLQRGRVVIAIKINVQLYKRNKQDKKNKADPWKKLLWWC